MLLQLLALGVEEGAAEALVLRDPAAGEGAVLDVGQHRPHALLGLLMWDNPGPRDILAELGGIGDRVVHGGDSALVDQVHNELHLMDALEVGVLRLIARLHQHLKAAAHQVHHTTAQHGLLAEQVGLRFVVEGGLHHARPGAADTGDVGQSQRPGPAGGILLHRHQAGHAFAIDVGGAHSMARPLGGGHKHIHPGRGDDLLVTDVEAVGKGQGLSLSHIGSDVLLVDVRLHLVVDKHHDDVRPLGCLGDRLDSQARRLCFCPALGALPQTHAYIAARVLQVESMGMALGAVADDGDLPPIQVAQVAVLLIVHLCHDKHSLQKYSIKIRNKPYLSHSYWKCLAEFRRRSGEIGCDPFSSATCAWTKTLLGPQACEPRPLR